MRSYVRAYHEIECVRLRGSRSCTCRAPVSLMPPDERHYTPLDDHMYSGHPWDGTRKEGNRVIDEE